MTTRFENVLKLAWKVTLDPSYMLNPESELDTTLQEPFCSFVYETAVL